MRWQKNIEHNREIYAVLDANLPTIEAGGTVTEEQIWNCVNLLLERESKVKNLAQPDVSGQYFSIDKLHQAFDGAREQKEIEIYLKDQDSNMKILHPYKYQTANEWIEKYFR